MIENDKKTKFLMEIFYGKMLKPFLPQLQAIDCCIDNINTLWSPFHKNFLQKYLTIE